MKNSKIKIDLHMHSESSYDCLTSLEEFKKVLDSNVLDKIAITDHSKIDLAFKLKEIYKDRVIIGEEIMTTDGEIIGLFLTKEIPRGLTPEKTIEEIRKQNGVVYLPHPFDKRRSGISKYSNYLSIIKNADIIEVFNSRCFSQIPNKIAQQVAIDQHKLEAAGSDAHSAREIGRSYIEMEDFVTKDEFLINLRSASLCKRKMKFVSLFDPSISKLKKKFK